MVNTSIPPRSSRGFSLTEVLTTISIIGILSSIAIPTFSDQMKRTEQREAEATIAQLMTQVIAYSDEYGMQAEGWDDLDDVAAVMTDTGTANGTSFSNITLPGGNYTLEGSRSGNDYVFTANPKNKNSDSSPPAELEDAFTASSGFNVLGCINVSTGASNIQTGDGREAASTSDLTCP